MLKLTVDSHHWRVRVWMWWLVLALATLLPVTASAADAIPAKSMTLLGSYGGQMYTIALEGSYVYVGQGASLLVVDVSNPMQPKQVGKSEFLPAEVKAIALRNGYAYLALGEAGIAVINVSSHSMPVVDQVVETMGSAQDLIRVGDYLWVASGLAGLRGFDISNSSPITLTGALNTPGFARQLATDGERVYVADGQGGLRVVDITTAATPVEVGFFEEGGEINSVAYGNSFVYTSGDNSYFLTVMNVSDPAHPYIESSVNNYGSLGKLEVIGEYLYAQQGSGIVILDSDPNLLSMKGRYEGDAISDFTVAGDYAFATDSHTGLRVLDINPPAAAGQVGLLPSLYGVESVAVLNNLAYVPDSYRGIAVLDVSQPAAIAREKIVDPCIGGWTQVTVAANTLIVDGSNGMTGRYMCFYSLTDPLSPQKIGMRQVTEDYWASPRVAARGTLLYVAEANNGASILDVNDPLGTPVGLYSQGDVYSVAAPSSSDRLLGVNDYRVLLLDVSVPASPQLLGEFDGAYGGSMYGGGGGPADGIGTWAFVYNSGSKRLDIIDFQIPASPQLLASVELPGDHAARVLAVGRLVLVANGSAGVRVIDVSTPNAPKEVAFYDPPADVQGLAVVGKRVYVAANEMGLLVLQLNIPTALDETVHPSRWRLALPLLAR